MLAQNCPAPAAVGAGRKQRRIHDEIKTLQARKYRNSDWADRILVYALASLADYIKSMEIYEAI